MIACDFCQGPAPAHGEMCPSCVRSYARTAHRSGTVYEAMRWAAGRTRRTERQRSRRAVRKQAWDTIVEKRRVEKLVASRIAQVVSDMLTEAENESATWSTETNVGRTWRAAAEMLAGIEVPR